MYNVMFFILTTSHKHFTYLLGDPSLFVSYAKLMKQQDLKNLIFKTNVI